MSGDEWWSIQPPYSMHPSHTSYPPHTFTSILHWGHSQCSNVKHERQQSILLQAEVNLLGFDKTSWDERDWSNITEELNGTHARLIEALGFSGREFSY